MSSTSAVRAAAPPSERSTLHILLAFAGFIALGLSAGVLGLAWTPMRAEFNQPLDALGLLLVAFTLGYLTSSFLVGTITARIGIGWTVLAGGAFMASMVALVAVTPVFWLLIPVHIAIGVGQGLIDAGLNAYVAEHHSQRTLNWLHASFGVGTTIAPILITFLIDREISWRIGYAVIAGYVVLLTVGYLYMRGRWRTMAAQTSRAADGVGVRLTDSLRIPAVWIGIIVFFVYAGLESSPGTWMYPLYHEARRIETATAGFWVSVYWASFTVGRIFFGAIINRVPTQRLIRICLFFTLLGAALIWFAPVQDTLVIDPLAFGFLTPIQAIPLPIREIGFFGLALLGFAQAPMFPVFISQTPARVGARHSPNAIGFQVAGAGIGVAVIPSLIGVFARRTSLEIVPPVLFFAAIAVIILYEISTRTKRGEQAA